MILWIHGIVQFYENKINSLLAVALFMLLLFNMITYCKSRMADWNNLLVLSAIFTRKSSCILVSFMADKKTTWMPSSEELVPNIFTPRPPNGDRNFCEKGYNATAALMGPNMLKDPKRPFQIVVERRGALSLLSLYFSGCDSSLRSQGQSWPSIWWLVSPIIVQLDKELEQSIWLGCKINC